MRETVIGVTVLLYISCEKRIIALTLFALSLILVYEHSHAKSSIKADIKSNILLHMAALLFLLNLYLKQDIGSVYVLIDFICI